MIIIHCMLITIQEYIHTSCIHVHIHVYKNTYTHIHKQSAGAVGSTECVYSPGVKVIKEEEEEEVMREDSSYVCVRNTGLTDGGARGGRAGGL